MSTDVHPNWKRKLPSLATNSRIVAGPILLALVAFLPPHQANWSMAILFAVASFTDYLDGYWARKYDAVSNWGKFMDPIADKILVLGALLVLMHQQKIEALMVLLLLGRDVFIGGIRSIAAAEQIIIDAKSTGKWKTAIQMLTIPGLFLTDVDPTGYLEPIAYWTLWFSVVLSLFSGWQYTNKYFQESKQA